MSVTTCKATYSSREGVPDVVYVVLVDGVLYRCRQADLDLLYDGIDPADLGLTEVEDEAE